jgi:hypothetical protein
MRWTIDRLGGKCEFAAPQHKTLETAKADLRRRNLRTFLLRDSSLGKQSFTAF